MVRWEVCAWFWLFHWVKHFANMTAIFSRATWDSVWFCVRKSHWSRKSVSSVLRWSSHRSLSECLVLISAISAFNNVQSCITQCISYYSTFLECIHGIHIPRWASVPPISSERTPTNPQFRHIINTNSGIWNTEIAKRKKTYLPSRKPVSLDGDSLWLRKLTHRVYQSQSIF